MNQVVHHEAADRADPRHREESWPPFFSVHGASISASVVSASSARAAADLRVELLAAARPATPASCGSVVGSRVVEVEDGALQRRAAPVRDVGDVRRPAARATSTSRAASTRTPPRARARAAGASSPSRGRIREAGRPCMRHRLRTLHCKSMSGLDDDRLLPDDLVADHHLDQIRAGRRPRVAEAAAAAAATAACGRAVTRPGAAGAAGGLRRAAAAGAVAAAGAGCRCCRGRSAAPAGPVAACGCAACRRSTAAAAAAAPRRRRRAGPTARGSGPASFVPSSERISRPVTSLIVMRTSPAAALFSQ